MVELPIDRIFCGDAVVLLQKIPDVSIDLIVTSPPYDKMRTYNGFCFDFEHIAPELTRVLKQGGVLVWIVGDEVEDRSETLTSMRQALYFHDVCKLNLHDTMIYEKSGFSNPSNNRYHQIWEYMFVFSKGAPKTFHPIKDHKNKDANTFGKARRTKDGIMANSDDKSRITIAPYGMRFNIWRYKTGKGNSTQDEEAYGHPAIFPDFLVRDHIASWSNEGDVVLDPFLGSGTTAKMALLAKRHYIGFDLSKEYIEIAKKRIKKAAVIMNQRQIMEKFVIKNKQ